MRELLLLLAPFVREHSLGDVIIAPADVVFGPRNMVEPDLFVVPLVDGAIPRAWEEVGRLLLAVEVLSPSTRRTDRREKRDLYQRKGVPEYWIIDVEDRSVDRWRPNDTSPETLTGTLDWEPDAAVPALGVDLPAYFDRVVGATT